MIEHEAWVGSAYEQGIEGEKIFIVGHSHYYGEAGDGNDLTIRIVREVMNHEQALSFFTAIRNYFGYSTHAEFWSRVAFFNYLPDCVGSPLERYNVGTDDQVARARARLIRLIGEHHPTKVFAFTNSVGKGWQEFPNTDQEKAGGQTIFLKGFEDFRWGTYTINRHVALAFGLRHPQGADGDLMRRAIQHILAM